MNSRLDKLRKLLTKQNLDAILVSDLQNITYLSNFSGFTTEDRDAYLLITKNKQYIFTHHIYREVAEKDFRSFDLIEIKRENPMSVMLKNIIEKEKITTLGFEAFDLKVNDFQNLTKYIDKKILISSNIVRELRIIKDHEEINAIKKACELGDKTFNFIIDQIKLGITEIELAVEIEYFIKRHNADISFSPIVAFGKSASQPHHVPDNTTLKKNSFVLFDFGTRLQNYCSDMTRTIFYGKPNKEQTKLYHAVLNAQLSSQDYIKNALLQKRSIPAPTVDQVGRDYIITQGYVPFNHSSHGIGLNVHESPRLYPSSNDTLTEGMVFSIEPGIYLPGKFGIRIEDIFAIENNRLIRLTKSSNELLEVQT
ncbi:MAG TPA: Xaa-Pro peptidase family protein [Candidatus Saccharimonadales bacterium]|nr:Xaa-Pro peptidase family protein [Candidatus Saccharimonadales bacterium]